MYKRQGLSMFIVLIVSAVVFILTVAYNYFSNNLNTLLIRKFNKRKIFYAMESAFYLTINNIRNTLINDNLIEHKTVNKKLLRILDESFINLFKEEFSFNIDNVNIDTKVSLIKLKNNPFKVKFSKEYPGLKNYCVKNEDSTFLAGWDGILNINIDAKYKNLNFHNYFYSDISVKSILPVARKYAFFINSSNTYYLKKGTFIVSSGIGKIIDISQDYINYVFNNLPKRGTFKDKIKLVREILKKIRFKKPQDPSIDEIYNEYKKSGRIRCNGILHVYLPFFEVDDIITYLVEDPEWERPEVGFPGCNNRLHDRFMSWATRFEGNIIKHYFVLPPLYVNTYDINAIPRADKYTAWSTFSKYVFKHPNEREPSMLKTYLANIDKFDRIYDNLKLSSTFNVNGLIFVKNNLDISGYYTGKAVIVVGNNAFIGNLKPANLNSSLSLIILNKAFLKYSSCYIKANIYAKDSIKGKNRLNIYGNLIVDNLNRYDKKGNFYMPRKVFINYDKNFKQEYKFFSISIRNCPTYFSTPKL